MLTRHQTTLRGFIRKHVATAVGTALLAVSGTASALLPFDNDGNLYVSMWNADTVAVFTKNGKSKGSITAPGLNGPRGIAFNPANGDIWIAGEHSNTIYVFDKQHRLRWTFTHPDFNEPVGITFKMKRGVKADKQEVYIANSGNNALDPSKGNNIMVFDQSGNLLRTFTQPNLVDPNCAAFMPDGSYYLSNRLGGGLGTVGGIDKYDANDNFLFSFTTPGIQSLMAVARDPNGRGSADDTVWATSGGGDRGIYEFDQDGNLLKSILPSDLAGYGLDPATIVPQGIAFDDNGDMTVASFSGQVLQFDGDGNFKRAYNTGPGNSRSIAFQYKDGDDDQHDRDRHDR